MSTVIIWISIILFCACMYIYFIKGEWIAKERYEWLLNRSFAHRGLFNNDGTVPENSLLAFEMAMNEGYGIELDVILTKDDKLVVFHDDCLERMATLKKKVWDCTYDELQCLPLGNSKQTIPLFSEVLTMIDGKVPIIVEIKTMQNREKLCRAVWSHLVNYKGFYCIESFDPLLVRWFRKHTPNVIRGQISMRYHKESKLPFITKFLLENMVCNFLSRPHFIAYSHQDRDKLCFRINRCLKYPTIGWTICSNEEVKNEINYFDSVIFECCQPPIIWTKSIKK